MAEWTREVPMVDQRHDAGAGRYWASITGRIGGVLLTMISKRFLASSPSEEPSRPDQAVGRGPCVLPTTASESRAPQVPDEPIWVTWRTERQRQVASPPARPREGDDAGGQSTSRTRLPDMAKARAMAMAVVVLLPSRP